MDGSGGIGAVSVGVSAPTLIIIGLVVVLVVGWCGWKIAKLLWIAFSG